MAYTYSSESESTQELRRQRGRATTSTRDRLFGAPPPPPPPPPRPANMAQQNPGGPPAAAHWAGMHMGYDDFDMDQFMQNVGLGGPPVSPIAGLQTPPPQTIPTSIGVGSTPVQTPTATTGVGVGTRRPSPQAATAAAAPQATSTPISRPPTTSVGKEPRRTSSRRLHRRVARRRRRVRATNTTTTTRTRARRTGANAFPSDSSHGSSSSSSSSNTPSRGNRLNQAEIRRQLQRLSNDQIQAARGRRIAGVTTTNTITTTYKDGGTPTVSRSSTSSRS